MVVRAGDHRIRGGEDGGGSYRVRDGESGEI